MRLARADGLPATALVEPPQPEFGGDLVGVRKLLGVRAAVDLRVPIGLAGGVVLAHQVDVGAGAKPPGDEAQDGFGFVEPTAIGSRAGRGNGSWATTAAGASTTSSPPHRYVRSPVSITTAGVMKG